MPDCGYCEASIDDEAAYHDHLRSVHADELGPIDRRRVTTDEVGGGLPTGPLAIGIVLLIAAAVVAYVVFLPGGGGADGDGPTNLWGVHYHGTLEVVIDGDRVDFSRPTYQLQADAFHFESDEGPRWHVHAEGVTLSWAMESLGIPVTAETVTFEGATYDDADPGTRVSITVDGDPVDPSIYVLRPEDEVRILVELG